MGFANTPAIQDHRITGLIVGMVAAFDRTGQIDSRYQWKLTDDWRFSGDGQCILVVKRGILDVDVDSIIR